MEELYAILISLFAGLSTGIGSLIANFLKKINYKVLSVGLSFSAGVMIYVSFMELLPEAATILGEATMIPIFFGGMFFMWFIDLILPEIENPHHPLDEQDFACVDEVKTP